MTWSRFDDAYDEHEKVQAAWYAEPAVVGLHVMATTACNRWLSDGVIRPMWILQRLPDPDRREQVLQAAVNHGLFDVLPAGAIVNAADMGGTPVQLGPFAEDRYMVHDFLERHDCAMTVKAKRKASSIRKAKWRAEKDTRLTGTDTETDVKTDGAADEGPTTDETQDGRVGPAVGPSRARPRPGASRPDPTRPDPTLSTTAGSGEPDEAKDTEAAKASEDVRRLCRVLAEGVSRLDPKFNVDKKASSSAWLRPMRLLIEADRGGDAAEVEHVLRFAQRDGFWHDKMLSPESLRRNWDKLRAKAGPWRQPFEDDSVKRFNSSASGINAPR